MGVGSAARLSNIAQENTTNQTAGVLVEASLDLVTVGQVKNSNNSSDKCGSLMHLISFMSAS